MGSELNPKLGVSPKRRRLFSCNQMDAVFTASGGILPGEGEPEQLLGSRITGEYFRVLGIRPASCCGWPDGAWGLWEPAS